MYGPDQYLATVVGVMFLSGVFLIIQWARQRQRERQQWSSVRGHTRTLAPGSPRSGSL
jgi:uncharacterized membrane protein HdeD (DUF308 family)